MSDEMQYITYQGQRLLEKQTWIETANAQPVALPEEIFVKAHALQQIWKVHYPLVTIAPPTTAPNPPTSPAGQ